MDELSEQPSQSALASTFPNPPPFWKHFTSENLARIEELRDAQADKDGSTDLPARIASLPDDLLHLQPPAEPADGAWKVLGGNYSLDDKLPSLEEGDIKRLAPAPTEEKDGKHLDRAFELKRMAKSLLLNFLELTGVMSMAPEDAAAKVDDLRAILMNFHHMLNEYRPHQARESAIALMQSHLDRTRAETAAIRAQVDKAKRVLEGLGSIEILEVPKPLGAAIGGEVTEQQLRDAFSLREKEVWAGADALFL